MNDETQNQTDKAKNKLRDELADKEFPPQYVRESDINTSLRCGYRTGWDACAAATASDMQSLNDKLQTANELINLLDSKLNFIDLTMLIIEGNRDALKALASATEAIENYKSATQTSEKD